MSSVVFQVRPFAGGFGVFVDGRAVTGSASGRDDALDQARALARSRGAARIAVYDRHGSLEGELFAPDFVDDAIA